MKALAQPEYGENRSQQDCGTPAWLATDLAATERLLMEQLQSAAPLVSEAGGQLIKAGGKRLRPRLSLLSAHACGYAGTCHIQLATVTELLHSATLLHDDVVDAAHCRRGLPSVNATWGDPAGVLVGDFLYSRALQLLVCVDSPPALRVLSDAMHLLAEGEVIQLSGCHDASQFSEQRYLQVIERKTAALFAATAHAGALLAEVSADTAQCFHRFGHHLGLAFQITDDVLDYRGEEAVVGKPCGSDFAAGKVTLPLILALRSASSAVGEMLRDALTRRATDAVQDVAIALVRETGGAEEALDCARRYQADALAALDGVPISRATQPLRELAEQAVTRNR